MQTFNPSSSEPTFACSDAWRTWWTDPVIRSGVLDTFERAAILLLFGSFLQALVVSIGTAIRFGQSVVIGDVMLLITETMMVFMVLFRRGAKSLSLRPGDWALAFSATCLSLLARPFPGQTHAWDRVAILLTIIGLMTQLVSKLTLGRRFGVVAANRGLCMSGPYRLVRHPIYMGYVLLHTGFFLLNPTLWNLCVFTTLYTIKIPRILAEERHLGQDPEYQQYMKKVRSRLIPGVF
ncbi:MAG TPA: isoprenylcysteine carboxylmethyltransferase family protein [Pirellula sp.]|nr:isoprenylcysteine carboxylmethyltransferase family protein [Pirellula sp.]